MKLKAWSEQQGISYWSALRYFHAGQIPGAVQLPTGTIEHRERLARFGFEYIEAAISPRKIIVLDNKELEDDLVRDVTEVLVSFCARLYGRRGAKNRAARALAKAAIDE